MNNQDKLQNAADINFVISPHILDESKDTTLYDMIVEHIIYKKYNINPNSICLHLHTKICIKKFPKLFQKKTKWLLITSYSIYKKPIILDQ